MSSEDYELAEKRKYGPLDLETNSETAEKKQATDDSFGRNRTIGAMPFLSVIPTATNSLAHTGSSSTDGSAVVTINMTCPQEKVPALIGPKGVTVQSIIKQSGCNKIYVDQDYPEGVPRQVVITGKPQSVSIASSLITQLLSEGSLIMPGQQQDNAVLGPNEELPPIYCPHNKVASLIGHVNEIMRRSGARVQVLQDGVPEGVDRKIAFTGTHGQVEEARKLVQMVLIEGPNFLFTSMPQNVNPYGGPPLISGMVAQTPTGSIIAEDDIQPEKVRVVIGSKGVTINEMMARSGCRININQNFPLGMPHKVTYTGSKEQIEVARYLVNACVEKGLSGLQHIYNRGDKLIFHEVNVFQSQMIRLLGPQGINMGDVQQRLHVKVAVETVAVMLPGLPEPVNKIGLVGNSDNVQEAVSLIYQYVDFVNTGGKPTINPAVSQQMYPGYGFPPANPYGGMGMDMGGYMSMPPGYGSSGGYVSMPAVSQPAVAVVAAPTVGQVLGLGEDGTAGQLEPAKVMPDGMHQQVADIKTDLVGRVIGKQSATAILIRNKSGANVQIIRPTDPTKTTTMIVLTGLPQCVSLASQMVQEVLVNGTAKLQQMSDVPLSVQVSDKDSLTPSYAMPSAVPTYARQYQQQQPMDYQHLMQQQQQQQQGYGGGMMQFQPAMLRPPMNGGGVYGMPAKR